MTQSGHDDLAKKRMLQARGEGLNLGKKISVPMDLMMEELKLPSTRGSRMFQERQRRVEKFILENTVNDNYNAPQTITDSQGGKENQAIPIPGKHSLIINLQKTVAKKGNPDVLAPGYASPLKDIPREKFNVTVIPKCYSSPWSGGPLAALSAQLPQLSHILQPDDYRCFNRSAMPFGVAMASKIPVIGFEALEPHNLSGITLSRMSLRPNFNSVPRGWGVNYTPESNEL